MPSGGESFRPIAVVVVIARFALVGQAETVMVLVTVTAETDLLVDVVVGLLVLEVVADLLVLVAGLLEVVAGLEDEEVALDVDEAGFEVDDAEAVAVKLRKMSFCAPSENP